MRRPHGNPVKLRHAISPAQVAQLVERLPSEVTDPGSILGRGHDPAVGWGDTMFKKNGCLGMLAGVFNTRKHILALHFTFTFFTSRHPSSQVAPNYPPFDQNSDWDDNQDNTRGNTYCEYLRKGRPLPS